MHIFFTIYSDSCCCIYRSHSIISLTSVNNHSCSSRDAVLVTCTTDLPLVFRRVSFSMYSRIAISRAACIKDITLTDAWVTHIQLDILWFDWKKKAHKSRSHLICTLRDRFVIFSSYRMYKYFWHLSTLYNVGIQSSLTHKNAYVHTKRIKRQNKEISEKVGK